MFNGDCTAPQSPLTLLPASPAQRLKKLDTHKIIIGDFYANKAREVMCQAYHLNMTARHGYVWFLPRWFNTNWYNMSLHIRKDRTKIPCTTEQMLEVSEEQENRRCFSSPRSSFFHVRALLERDMLLGFI